MTNENRLFTAEDSYTENGLELDRQVVQTLRPIFSHWISRGCSIREISHVAQLAVVDLELTAVLENYTS